MTAKFNTHRVCSYNFMYDMTYVFVRLDFPSILVVYNTICVSVVGKL